MPNIAIMKCRPIGKVKGADVGWYDPDVRF